MSWKEEAEQLKFDEGLSWSKVYAELKHYFPELTDKQAEEKIKGAMRKSPKYHAEKPKGKINNSNRTVGVFGDAHIPFDHPNYLKFLIDTFEQYNVGQVVCLGDLVDNHAISRHQTEACAKSPYDELDMSIGRIGEYTKAFPKVKMIYGNHDLIAIRQAATLGMGERFLKPLAELLKLPTTWELADEYIIDDVLYRHGVNCTGVNGALNTALRERMSTCIGHTHSNAGVSYAANKRDIIFGAHCGCGIDVSAYAFAYGAYSKNRPILGCTIVFNSDRAEFVPMGSEYFRD